MRRREGEVWDELKKRTKRCVCDKSRHWKRSPECKGAPSLSTLLCGECGAPVTDISVAKKAKYDAYWASFTSYDKVGYLHSDDQSEESEKSD